MPGELGYWCDDKLCGHHVDKRSQAGRLEDLIANRIHDPTCLQRMAAQAMPVLGQGHVLTRQVIGGYYFVMAKRRVGRHGYDDWIFLDFHSLDIAKFVRNGHQQNVELSACELVQQDWSRSLPHVQLELRQRSAQMRQQRGQDIRPDCRDYPNRSGPDNGSCALWAHPTSSSASTSRRWARVAISLPNGVSITWRWLRSNSVTPSRPSSSLIPPLSVDCVTAQLSAARPKWHCSASAHRKRSC